MYTSVYVYASILFIYTVDLTLSLSLALWLLNALLLDPCTIFLGCKA